MITSRFPLGDVSFTAGYFSTLVGEATKHCYGVAAMALRIILVKIQSFLFYIRTKITIAMTSQR